MMGEGKIGVKVVSMAFGPCIAATLFLASGVNDEKGLVLGVAWQEVTSTNFNG